MLRTIIKNEIEELKEYGMDIDKDSICEKFLEFGYTLEEIKEILDKLVK